VIEDAAHAIGTEYKGKRIGSFGDIQVFSFHPNKNMTTGEGGCVVTRDDKIAEAVALLRFHGMDREAWNRFGKKGSQHYEIIVPGYKYNMMDIQAARLHQLKQLDGSSKPHRACGALPNFEGWPQLSLLNAATRTSMPGISTRRSSTRTRQGWTATPSCRG
jgi:dTDP-4-amino-4,6-dideoxygalactose transaminase